MYFSEQQRLNAVVDTFDTLFNHNYRTCLIGGAQEPMYVPATSVDQLHRLFYRADYLSSALHEVAHWCIAGPQRLLQQDFGYWYRPDGRSSEEQSQFEKVEVKPQALEWMFSIVCGHHFSVSLDNLNNSDIDNFNKIKSFERAISNQCIDWCIAGNLPARAERFIGGLMTTFTTFNPYDAKLYQMTSSC